MKREYNVDIPGITMKYSIDISREYSIDKTREYSIDINIVSTKR